MDEVDAAVDNGFEGYKRTSLLRFVTILYSRFIKNAPIPVFWCSYAILGVVVIQRLPCSHF
jgi:hypothetical protein